MAADAWNLDDVLVVVGHPWGDFVTPLLAWMATGPTARHGCRPGSTRSRSTAQALPLTVIPLAYRNDRQARALIAAGRIDSPWRDRPWLVEEWGPRPCGVFGPRPLARSVTDPGRVDRVAAAVLQALPPGPAVTGHPDDAR